MNFIELKIITIFLYEFYKINNITYQTFLNNNLNNDNKLYTVYCKKSLECDCYLNLLDLFGFNSKIPPTINNMDLNQHLILKYNSNNCGVYIYDYDSILTIKLYFLFLLDINAQTKYNWCRYISTKFIKSEVIHFTFIHNKSFEINFDLDKLNIIANNQVWINIFKILIRYPDYIYSDIQFDNLSIYPIKLITNTNWLINSNDYIHLSTKNKLDTWINNINWIRKKNYIMTLNNLSKLNKLNDFYNKLFKLDKFLYTTIINYI